MTLLILIYAAIVAALTGAEYARHRRFQYILKPLAASGFILLALLSGALYSPYGLMILWALIFCALGDLCLLTRNHPRLFKLGMAGFGLGHILYAYAFAIAGQNLIYMIGGAILIALFALPKVYSFLKPHLSEDMKPAVLVYMTIIGVMVIFAIGGQQPLIILPALMFATSDIFVARDRFVGHIPTNALIITPLYFGAQALFALGVFL